MWFLASDFVFHHTSLKIFSQLHEMIPLDKTFLKIEQVSLQTHIINVLMVLRKLALVLNNGF